MNSQFTSWVTPSLPPVSGKELEVEENEVAIPIPVSGQLVPIEEEIQVLPDELVGTQVAFELAEEDRPPSYK